MCSMLNTFLLFVMLIITQYITGVYGGQVVVLHSPKSLKLLDNFGNHQDVLKELYCAVLGSATPQENHYNLISFVDPFDTPEAVVEVYIAGVTDIGPFYGPYKTYSMQGYCNLDTFEYVTTKLNENYLRLGRSIQVKMNLNDVKDLQLHKDLTYAVKNFTEIHTNILNHNDPTTKLLFEELNVLHGITAALKNKSVKRDHIKDFYHFRVNSLLPIIEKNGPISAQVLEAKRLFNQHLVPLSEAFVKTYDGKVLVTAVASENDKDGCQREERQVTERFEQESGEWKRGETESEMKGNEDTRGWKAGESGVNVVKRGKWMTGEIDSETIAVARGERKTSETKSELSEVITDIWKTGQKETKVIKEWNLAEPQPKHGPLNSEIDKKYKYVWRQDETPGSSAKPGGIETPVIFHIIFWTCFALSFSVLAIVRVFMMLDPGRDSIVYRLTDNLTSKKTE